MARPGNPGKIDYARIEPGWRAGLLSRHQLAQQYTAETGVSVTHVAIVKHFKKCGVPRDLSAKIRARADALVTAAMANTAPNERRDDKIVADGAAVVADVRLSHRADIQRSRRCSNRLLEELERMIGLEFEDVGSLKEPALILKQLVDAQKTVIGLEREAYGISSEPPADTVEALPIDPVDGARRLAFILQRAGHLVSKS